MAVSLPFTFTNGTVADATQVNANFNALATAVDGGGITLNPPASPNSTITDQLIVRTGQVGAIGLTSRIGLNAYLDSAGVFRYVANGPAATIGLNSGSPAGPGTRISIAVADIGTAGAVAATEGILNILYGPQGGGAGKAYVVIGNATHILSIQPPTDSLVCGEVISTALSAAMSPSPAGTMASRIHLNSWADATGAQYYLNDGPAYLIQGRKDTNEVNGWFSTAGLAGQPCALPFTELFSFNAAFETAIDFTNFTLIANRAGSPEPIKVLVGAPNSAMPGYRALCIPN